MSDVDIHNARALMGLLATVDPSLWRIKKKLVENNINPELLPPIIEGLSSIVQTTNNGVIQLNVRDGVVELVKSTNVRELNLELTDKYE